MVIKDGVAELTREELLRYAKDVYYRSGPPKARGVGLAILTLDRLLADAETIHAEMEKGIAALEAKLAEAERERDEAHQESADVRTQREEAHASTSRAIERLRAAESREKALREALGRLVRRLDEVHADGSYLGVWQIAQLHLGPYRGPTYVEALDAARAALAAGKGPDRCTGCGGSLPCEGCGEE